MSESLVCPSLLETSTFFPPRNNVSLLSSRLARRTYLSRALDRKTTPFPLILNPHQGASLDVPWSLVLLRKILLPSEILSRFPLAARVIHTGSASFSSSCAILGFPPISHGVDPSCHPPPPPPPPLPPDLAFTLSTFWVDVSRPCRKLVVSPRARSYFPSDPPRTFFLPFNQFQWQLGPHPLLRRGFCSFRCFFPLLKLWASGL